MEECADGSDEGEDAGCDYAAYFTYSDNGYCPADKFFCYEDGSCIDRNKRCDGNSDCPNGSDEDRDQNCELKIRNITCGVDNGNLFNITDRWPEENDTYHKVWTGMFRCNNGQCINASYACDGTIGMFLSHLYLL